MRTIRIFATKAKQSSFLPTQERRHMDTSGVLCLPPRAIGALFGALLYCSQAYADGTAVTTMTYDAGNNVASVTDPRGLVTNYTHDGLGQLWQQVSPDTGTSSYGYDSISRMTSVSAGGQTQTFTYDNCTDGIGRLCSDSDATGVTSYSYTPEGWLAGRGFSVSGTTYAIGYSRDSMGHLATVDYPDGNVATYAYVDGAVSAVTLKMGSTTINAATAITYQPMDMAMSTWTSSNGLTNTMSYDTDGRLTGISVPGKQALGFNYDSANRISKITNGIDSTLTQSFGYDFMSRLNAVSSATDNESLQYDANGNRINQTGTIDTVSATSNQLLSNGSNQYGYDAIGNTTTVNGVARYHYDVFNRMDSAAGMAYYVNPEGQRLRKSGAAGTTYFAPDQGGAMLAENPGNGWIDYVWLNGRLIGRMDGDQVDAIHDDQLGRPEVVTDASQAVVWSAQNFAFTQHVVVADITLNLGFPGQYYDAETSAWNNGFRDYKSGLGRYVESDPIGLSGGINTYAYVGNDPLTEIDPLGLCGCTVKPGAFSNNPLKDNFITATNVSAANSVANELNVTTADILAVAALESRWGTSNFALRGNNFYGLHAPQLGQSGTVIGSRGVVMAAFRGFGASTQAFANNYGGIVQGQGDPTAFFSALQGSGKFGIDPATGAPVSTYVPSGAATARGIAAGLTCTP